MLSIAYIISEVEGLISKHSTRDPFSLCKELDIAVRYKDCGATLNAYFITVARIKNIVLNNRVGGVAARVLAAHELGHAVLHKEIAYLRGFSEMNIFSGADIEEFEANVFAAELLIDDDELLELLDERDYFSAARALYVPVELLEFKLRALSSKGYGIKPLNIAKSDFLKHSIDGISDGDFTE